MSLFGFNSVLLDVYRVWPPMPRTNVSIVNESRKKVTLDYEIMSIEVVSSLCAKKLDDDLRGDTDFPWDNPSQEYCSGLKVSDCLCQKGRKVSRDWQMANPKAADHSRTQRQKGYSSCRVRRFQSQREACLSRPRDGALHNPALLLGHATDPSPRTSSDPGALRLFGG